MITTTTIITNTSINNMLILTHRSIMLISCLEYFHIQLLGIVWDYIFPSTPLYLSFKRYHRLAHLNIDMYRGTKFKLSKVTRM